MYYECYRHYLTWGLSPGKASVELSKKARQRLKWFDYYHLHGHNAVSPAATMASVLKPSIAGKDAIIPGTWRALKTALTVLNICASLQLHHHWLRQCSS